MPSENELLASALVSFGNEHTPTNKERGLFLDIVEATAPSIAKATQLEKKKSEWDEKVIEIAMPLFRRLTGSALPRRIEAVEKPSDLNRIKVLKYYLYWLARIDRDLSWAVANILSSITNKRTETDSRARYL